MIRASSALLRVLEAAVAIGLLVIASTVVIQVVLSSCFNSSITGANELITKLFAYVTAIGAAIAVGRGEHIAISFATDRLTTRVQPWIERLELLLVGCLNAVVVAYSVHWIQTTGHYLMPTTQLPRIVAQLSVPLGSGLAVLFCVLRIVVPAKQDAASEQLQ